MVTNIYAESTRHHENPPPHGANPSSWATAEASFEFGGFRVLLRQRQLLADGVSTGLGTRAFDLLLILLESSTVPALG